MENEVPLVSFGKYGKPLIDWSKEDDVTNELDDNDEDVATPKDVIAILGFDPDKEK